MLQGYTLPEALTGRKARLDTTGQLVACFVYGGRLGLRPMGYGTKSGTITVVAELKKLREEIAANDYRTCSLTSHG
jgi:hypothetical protein